MNAAKKESNRIVALDMHPDVFSAACLQGPDPAQARTLWTHDRRPTAQLEQWAGEHLAQGDAVVLEASGNSFEVAHRLHQLGHVALVLESCQAGRIKHGFCDDDRQSAIKLARVYLTGLAKIVWQPDERTRQLRELLFAYRNSVKDATRSRNRIRSYLNERCVRLPEGTQLTQPSGKAKAPSARGWSPLQKRLLEDAFDQLWAAETRRKGLESAMAQELATAPKWARLWRLMGARHRVAFALMAMVGDGHRFPTAKKLVAYLGLAPRRKQSGNDEKGRQLGIGNGGRGDVRALPIQSAHNALSQKASPLHGWGWKLLVRKNRQMAVAAVARKLAVAIWHLLKGHYCEMLEASEHLIVKLYKIATVIGKEALKEMGFAKRSDFIDKQIELLKQTT